MAGFGAIGEFAIGELSPSDFTVPIGTVGFAGRNPVVLAGAAVLPNAGDLVFAGRNPHIAVSATVHVEAGALTFSGRNPLVASGGSVIVDAGELSFAGNNPIVQTGVNIRPNAGQLSFAGNNPIVQTGVNIRPNAGEVVLTGRIPRTSTVGALVEPGVPTFVEAIGAIAEFAIGEFGDDDDLEFLISGRMALEPRNPVIQTGVNIRPNAGEIIFEGQNPEISARLRPVRIIAIAS